jgi:chorismate-pyruvate lyase
MPQSSSAQPEESAAEVLVGAHRDSEQLIRLLRDSDSATRTLAAWTGCPIRLDVVNRCDDRLTATEFADLEVPPDEPVQRREVRLLALDKVLSEASATVVLGRVPPSIAVALRDTDVPLGLVLGPLHVRRHTLSVKRREPSADGDINLLFEVVARLDVGGCPVALVRERYLTGVLS